MTGATTALARATGAWLLGALAGLGASALVLLAIAWLPVDLGLELDPSLFMPQRDLFVSAMQSAPSDLAACAVPPAPAPGPCPAACDPGQR